MIFDYVAAARRAGISQEALDRVCALVQAEFPTDAMMAELHILRIILSVERGDTTLDSILGTEALSR